MYHRLPELNGKVWKDGARFTGFWARNLAEGTVFKGKVMKNKGCVENSFSAPFTLGIYIYYKFTVYINVKVGSS